MIEFDYEWNGILIEFSISARDDFDKAEWTDVQITSSFADNGGNHFDMSWLTYQARCNIRVEAFESFRDNDYQPPTTVALAP